MKKHILLALAVLLVATGAMAAQRRNITFNQLPPSAQSYLRTYLADQSVRQCTEITDEYRVQYEVKLTNNSVVIFNRDGGWRSLYMPVNKVPHDILPAEVHEFLLKNYGRNYEVTKIAKTKEGYRVTIDGNELLCSSNNMKHMQKQIDDNAAYRDKHDGQTREDVQYEKDKRTRDRRRFFNLNDDGSRNRETQDKRVKSNGRP